MPSIRSVSVSGFKSFADTQTLEPGVPDGNTPCSGLTILVGPNNGGKSALLEAIHLMAGGQSVGMPRAHRHDATEYMAKFEMTWSDNKTIKLESDSNDPQSLTTEPKDTKAVARPVLHVGVNRELPGEINQSRMSREDYVTKQPHAFQREGGVNFLANRMMAWRTGRFRELLDRVIDFRMRQYTEGQRAYVKVGEHEHGPQGLGYGVAALMHIIDAIRDAGGTTVLIDEPELSLHPSYQRRLLSLLAEQSAKTQIIYGTHSPYMADWYCVSSGATLARIAREGEMYSKIHTLSRSAAENVASLLENLRNPHILGTNASEVFFLQDGVVLVEGQDDVVYYRRMAADLGTELRGEFYGWGVGGADNLSKVARVLDDLGYRKVVGVLDGNRAELVKELQGRYPRFHFLAIPADDVRDKKASTTKECKGLCDGAGKIHDEHRVTVKALFETLNEKLAG